MQKLLKLYQNIEFSGNSAPHQRPNILKGKNSSEVCVREQYFKGYFLTIPRETDGIQVSSESHVFEH